jgi:hypothetical protein
VGVHADDKRDREYVQRVERILRDRDDVRAGDHRLMAHLVGEATGSLTRWLVHQAPPALDRESAVAEIVRMLLLYVRE